MHKTICSTTHHLPEGHYRRNLVWGV